MDAANDNDMIFIFSSFFSFVMTLSISVDLQCFNTELISNTSSCSDLDRSVDSPIDCSEQETKEKLLLSSSIDGWRPRTAHNRATQRVNNDDDDDDKDDAENETTRSTIVAQEPPPPLSPLPPS